MAEPDEGGYVIDGPDVAIIGWIPYAFDLDDMAENAFTRHRHRHGFAWLFDSGNSDPPERFEGYEGFREFLMTKEFRGACCLRNVALKCAQDGTPRSIVYDREEHIGYTPYRMWNRSTRSKVTIGRERGQRQAHCEEEVSGNGLAIITQSLAFRVGTMGNLGSWVMVGRPAPWVDTFLQYNFSNDLELNIFFGGSVIPSQRYYVDWSSCGGHDMLAIGEGQIDSFFAKGRGEYADMNASPVLWKGRGRLR